jgi:Protein of unknown function (DUF3035)
MMKKEHMNRILVMMAMTIFTLPVTACSNARESLGLNKDAPDEFAVVRHAPLAMPPAIVLPPPNPGQQRPQEQTTSVMAQEAIFGQAHAQSNSAPSSAEAALLNQTGGQVDPNIRQELETESDELKESNKPVIQKLLGIGGVKVQTKDEALDPKEESKRLQQEKLPTPEIPPELLKDEKKKK